MGESKWLSLTESERKNLIQDFYESGNPALAEQFIGIVRAPHGYGVYASAGTNYEYSIFGRDSIRVAEDLLNFMPNLSAEIIKFLASLQGVATNPISEEESGRIHHEYRPLLFDNQPISPNARRIYETLAAKWSSDNDQVCYYGSVDATPLFVRLVNSYCQKYGNEILSQPIIRRDGKVASLRICVRDSVAWVAKRILASSWGLLEFRRSSFKGVKYQAWKDSLSGYMHTDGSLANADQGVASVEVQGYAYDCLNAASQLVANNQQETDQLDLLAAKVRDNTLKYLWMPKEEFFAMGLDRDNSGNTRQIATLTTNAGRVLSSDFWQTLKKDEAKKYTSSIVKRLMSDDFLTSAGLRTRANRHVELIDFTNYHGCLVTWPQDTLAVARAMAKLGYSNQAKELEDAVITAVHQAGEFYEFFMVDEQGRVKLHYPNDLPYEPKLDYFKCSNIPEVGQAWTISAIIRTVLTRATISGA